MSKNRIVKAFWQDIQDHGLPLGATISSWATQWADALDAFETDPDLWESVDSELREGVLDAIGSPANRFEIDGFLAEQARIVPEAITKLREVANR